MKKTQGTCRKTKLGLMKGFSKGRAHLFRKPLVGVLFFWNHNLKHQSKLICKQWVLDLFNITVFWRAPWMSSGSNPPLTRKHLWHFLLIVISDLKRLKRRHLEKGLEMMVCFQSCYPRCFAASAGLHLGTLPPLLSLTWSTSSRDTPSQL